MSAAHPFASSHPPPTARAVLPPTRAARARGAADAPPAAPPGPPPASDSLLQSPVFAEALALLGQRTLPLDNGLFLLQRRVMGLPLLMLPRAAPPADLAAQLAARGLHRLPLILSPENPVPTPRAIRLKPHIYMAELPLSPDPESQRAALHGKWRNQLRRAEKSGLHIDHAPLAPDPDHPLLRAAMVQEKTRGYRHWPAPLTAAFAALAPKQTRLFRAYQGSDCVAQMLFLLHGARASYHIGMTSPAGRAVHAHNLLLFNASCWLAAAGVTRLDLGILHPGTPDLNRFKRRAGAVARPTGGTFLRWHPLARGPGP